jgi:RND family efflux transporter MFP subunit
MRNLFAEGAASKRDVETAEAAWRSTDAQNAAAAKRLADATVRAPFAGTVSRRAVQAGDRVASGDPMFTVVNTSVLEFEASVPTEYIASVKPGARVRLSVTGYTAGELGGEVARVNATADPATRQVQVYVRVPNRKGELVGGLFASGDIVTNQSHEALSVPAPAIRTEGDATYAIVIEAGRLARRAISIGVRDDGRGLVEVKSGLEAGDVVLTGPLEGLVPGQRVTVGGKES